jgi:hypothetical protein
VHGKRAQARLLLPFAFGSLACTLPPIDRCVQDPDCLPGRVCVSNVCRPQEGAPSDASPPASPDATATVDEPGPPEGMPPWPVVTWSGHSYFFSDAPVSWVDARAVCTRFGFDLVSIDTEAENAWLVSVLPERADLMVWWIGLRDAQGDSMWTWSNGSMSTFVNWAPGEPNYPGYQNCAQLVMQPGMQYPSGTPAGVWNNSFCMGVGMWALCPFVCEK